MEPQYIKSFMPIANYDSKILILGSMPGVESLNRQEYYAHPRNQFWKILFTLFNNEYVDAYDKKVNLLLKNNIALWDVIYSCNRKGSLDSDIINESVNDFKSFFALYPNIMHVYFNGSKAFDTFKKKVGFELYSDKMFTRLTSTSPANTMKFERKLNDWSQILKESY